MKSKSKNKLELDRQALCEKLVAKAMENPGVRRIVDMNRDFQGLANAAEVFAIAKSTIIHCSVSDSTVSR